MSHFSVLVIGQNIEEQLQPFHEFECTGINDQFIQDIDETEKVRAEFEQDTTTRLRAPDGSLHQPYDERFYRDPSLEEVAAHGPMMGSGGGGGIAWSSRDWNDGLGHRAKVKFIPDGWEEVEVPHKEVETFAKYVEGYHGKTLVAHGTAPDIAGAHKFGYALADEAGNVAKVVDRTNPNAEWDWWTVGGRYSERLILKDGSKVDSAIKGDVDFDAKRAEVEALAATEYDAVRRVIDGTPESEPWATMRERLGVDTARAEYRKQPRVAALEAFSWSAEGRELVSFDASPEDYAVPREQFLQAARDRAISTFAFLKDGQWTERGDMGWFGCVANEKDQAAWDREFAAMLDALPDDALLTIVDCHI